MKPSIGTKMVTQDVQAVRQLLAGSQAREQNLIYLQDELFEFRAKDNGRLWSVYGSPVSSSRRLVGWTHAFMQFFLLIQVVPIFRRMGFQLPQRPGTKYGTPSTLLAYPFIMLLGYASAIPKTDILYVTLDCSRHIIVGLSQKTQQPHTRSAFWRIRSSNVG